MTRFDASFEHVASTPIAVPTGEPGPLVTAPAGPVDRKSTRLNSSHW